MLRRLVVAAVCAASTMSFSGGATAAEREFNLTIEEVTVKVAADLDYKVFAFNGQVPGPLLRVQEGDDLKVNVTNNTTLPDRKSVV